MKIKKKIIFFILICILLSPLSITAAKTINIESKEIIKLDIKSNLINPSEGHYLTDEEIKINYEIIPKNILKDLITNNNGLINNVEIIKHNENSNLNKFGASYELNDQHSDFNNIKDIYLLYSSKSYNEVKNKLNNLNIDEHSNKNGNKVPLQSYYQNKNKLKYEEYFHNHQIPLFELSKPPTENSEDYLNGEFYAYVLIVDDNYDIIDLKKSNYPIGDSGDDKIQSLERIISIDYNVPKEIRVIEDQNFKDLGLKYENNKIIGELTNRLIYKLQGDYYKAESIKFNIKFTSNKSGIYNLPKNNSKISFNDLKDLGTILEFPIPSQQIKVKDSNNNIKIDSMGLLYDNDISYINNPIDLAIENKYSFGVKFTSSNINAKNTDIEITPKSNNIIIDSYKLYRYDKNKKQFLEIHDGVKYNQKNNLTLNVSENDSQNTYILVYNIKGNTISNINNTVTFNKTTNAPKSITKQINFVDWPNID